MTEDRVVAFRDPAGVRPLVPRPARATATWSPPRAARSTSSARSCCARCSPASWSRSASAASRPARRSSPTGRALCVFEHIYFSRPDTKLEGRTLQSVRGRMGEILAREAPVEADLVISVPDSGNAAAKGFARASGIPQDDGLIKNRYVGAHVHPARAGAAPPRPAHEVQPAARGGQRQAPGGRGRLDRARQHHAPDRQHAARGGREGGPPADVLAADPPPMPLRRRHADQRGDDRPRAHGRRGRRARSSADSLAYLSLEGVYEAVGSGRETHCDACFTGDYPLEGDHARERQARARRACRSSER